MVGCIVLDICMLGMDGMELQKKFNDKYLILFIIFVIGYGDVLMVVDVMKEGVVDFIQKLYWEEVLLEKIEVVLFQDFEQCKILDEKQEIICCVKSLILCEYEIMDWMIVGQVNKVIVIEFEISQCMVEIYCFWVMYKMGIYFLVYLVCMVLFVKDFIDVC